MKIIDGEKHYTAKEVGMLVGRTHLTVHLWDTWSNELAERGDSRLIPEPIKLGKQKTRYWNEKDLTAIEHFAQNIHRGDLAEFSQRQWSKKSAKTSEKKDISYKRKLKAVDAHSELTIEDKLIFSLIYLLDKEGEETTISMIEKCFSFSPEAIEMSLQSLKDFSLIIERKNKYVVL